MFTPARRVGGDGPLTAVGEVSSLWWRRLSQTPTLFDCFFFLPLDACYSGTWTNASRVTLLGRILVRAAGVDAGIARSRSLSKANQRRLWDPDAKHLRSCGNAEAPLPCAKLFDCFLRPAVSDRSKSYHPGSAASDTTAQPV